MTGTMTAIKEHWINQYKRNAPDHPRMLTKDPFVDWDLSSMPEGAAELKIMFGLQTLYGEGDIATARGFFDQGLAICERALKEEKFKSDRCKSKLPLNRGMLLRARAYATGLLGTQPSTEWLLQAADDFLGWIKDFGKGDWDSHAQAYHLAAVRLSLLAHQSDQAQELLKTKRSLKQHIEEKELLLDLCAMQPGRGLNEVMLTKFDKYFDRIRDPRDASSKVFIESTILPLELGLLRDMYLVSADGEVTWRRVIAAISQ